jgi:hypothetical protein
MLPGLPADGWLVFAVGNVEEALGCLSCGGPALAEFFPDSPRFPLALLLLPLHGALGIDAPRTRFECGRAGHGR